MNDIYPEIIEYTKKHSDIEACGVIGIQGKKYVFIPITNNHINPNNNFTLDAYEYALAEDSCDDVLSIFHSHINGKGPSFHDKISCNALKINFTIYDIKNNKFYHIEPKQVQYLDKQFEIGINDCYSLVREYYKEELSISLRNYYRDQSWFQSEKNFFDHFYNEAGFIEVTDLKPNDCILFKIKAKTYSDHIGVYIDNNKFLHHPIKGKSELIDLSKYKKYINKIIRHESLT